MSDPAAASTLGAHGAGRLPAVTVDSYNVALRDEDGFVGDRARKAAFVERIDAWRKALRKAGGDPFGDLETEDISKSQLEDLLKEGDPEAAGLLQGAIEEFAQTLALVTRRFLRLKAWRDTERIAVGGGFREGRIGELVIGRAAVLLKAEGAEIDMAPIRHHPDEAGLIGAVHLAPSWIFEAHDSILAVDIGGSNIRAGVLELRVKKARDLSKVAVWKSELWRHADDEPGRDEAVAKLAGMLKSLIRRAEKEKFKLAPFVGIGCPGTIAADGAIERGAQNLPGNWQARRFNLPQALAGEIRKIGDHETVVIMHNDAVVQGLSELPRMRDVERWGVLTIGTGLGNARFTNRSDEEG